MHKAVFIFLLGTLLLSNSNAQQAFYSQSLQNLYGALPDKMCSIVNNTTLDTVVLCSKVVQGDTVPIVFRWDENRVLEHIGYRFLSENLGRDNAIVRFLERELLEVLLSANLAPMLATYRENGLSVKLDDIPVKQSFLQNKRLLLNLLKKNQNFSINYDGAKNYVVRLVCANGQTLSFHFIADSKLISGMDKKERDIRLAVQLKNYKAKDCSVAAPDFNYLQLLHDSVYVGKGRSFMIPEINNDLYYKQINSTYSLVFNARLIAYTFSNALVGPANREYTINITHRMYGYQENKYTVSSRNFDAYFYRDYDRYFGIKTIEDHKLTGTLILSDRNAGCVHLASVSISLDDLLMGGTIEMQLHSNIPIHNLKTLFG